MGTPLKNPPVYFTLVQVRFNPILTIPDFLPGIQESFRKAGYPDFDRQQFFSYHLKTGESQPSAPTTISQDRFQFGDVQLTHAFILDNQSLTLQSTNYGQFESFASCFLAGLRIVHDAVTLSYTERVGLRYLDRVMPQNGETIEQYLAEQVHGLTSHLGGRPLYSYSEGMNDVDGIKLLSRVAIQEGPLVFPPDIQEGKLRVIERFKSYDKISAILDNDGFIENRVMFSEKTVTDQLNTIHKVIGNAFKTTATPFARAAWDR